MPVANRKAPLTSAIVVGFCSAALLAGAACSAPATERLGSGSAAGTTAFPNDQKVFDYFRAKGFTTFQAAGIVGNLDQESGIDPTISQSGGGPGRGIAQWSAGGRWDTAAGDNVVAFAATEGQSPDTLGVQLDFIMFELQNFSDYGLAKLQATTNVSDAATEFELDYEGCDIASECDGPSRISYAQSVLAAYANDPVETDAGAPATDAGSAADAGNESEDSGGSPVTGTKDSGTHGGTDAGTPTSTEDAGTPGTGTPGTGSSDDAGSTSSPAITGPSTGGCTMTTRGAACPTPAIALAALGVVFGIRRRRRAQRARG